MSNIFRNIMSNTSTRILVIIFACLLGITIFFITFGYYAQLEIYESKELTRLQSIARTIALQIDGDAHDILFNNETERDAIKTNAENDIYREIHEQLKEVEAVNNIQSTIYTLVYLPEKEKVCYGIATSEEPFYRHEYKKYPPILIEKYNEGALIGQYETENGTWLSAFAPIKNMKGETVAVVQLDQPFDSFIDDVDKKAMRTLAISLFIIALVAFILLRSIRSILRKEQELKHSILESKHIIEEKNKDITDSIHYAKRIQDAILPSIQKIKSTFPDSFVFYKPRDIVSGDFYWFMETKEKYHIAAVDCTGHGVPGAFMSMIGHTLLNDIITRQNASSSGEILDALDVGIKNALKQGGGESQSRDGMDLALCSIDKSFDKFEYSGAFRPLLYFQKDDMAEIKGNRFPIGGGVYDNKTNFETHKFDIKEGDTIYLYSDGFPDQFGGKRDKKFMNKRFKKLLEESQDLPLTNQQDILEKEFNLWKQDNEQVDDVIIVGIRF